MTAPIVTHDGRNNVKDAEHYCQSADWSDADTTARERDVFTWSGQLWERLGEQPKLNADAITPKQWGRMAVVRNTLGTRHPNYALNPTGPAVRRSTGSYSPYASGSVQYGTLLLGHGLTQQHITYGLTSIDDE